MKLISGGKILENDKSVAQCRAPFGDLPSSAITMHVVVQPSSAKSKPGELQVFTLNEMVAYWIWPLSSITIDRPLCFKYQLYQDVKNSSSANYSFSIFLVASCFILLMICFLFLYKVHALSCCLICVGSIFSEVWSFGFYKSTLFQKCRMCWPEDYANLVLVGT